MSKKKQTNKQKKEMQEETQDVLLFPFIRLGDNF